MLYDVSPLPKDDDNLSPLNILTKEGSRDTLHNEVQTLEESALHNTTVNPIIQTSNVSSDDEKSDDEKHKHTNAAVSTLGASETQLQSNEVPRSESLYYTPDNTMEKLSDLNIN